MQKRHFNLEICFSNALGRSNIRKFRIKRIYPLFSLFLYIFCINLLVSFSFTFSVATHIFYYLWLGFWNLIGC